SVVIVSFTSGLGWIVVACLLLGVGTSPLWPCVINGATTVAGNESSGTIMSVVYMAWLTGVGCGPIVINFFIVNTYKPAFRILLGMMVIVVLVAFFLPGRSQSKALENGDDVPVAAASELAHEKHLSWLERIRRYFAKVGKSLHASKLLYPAMFTQNFA